MTGWDLGVEGILPVPTPCVPFRFLPESCRYALSGVGEVIKGWDLGVEGMRVGDKRHLVIPAQLAYGTSGVKGTIPPNSVLEFDVQLVDVK